MWTSRYIDSVDKGVTEVSSEKSIGSKQSKINISSYLNKRKNISFNLF